MISIVLPIHNQAQQLRPMIDDYLAELSRVVASSELILVLNGCTDDSAAVAGKLARPGLRRIVSQEAGWGRAVRLGLAAAQGEIVCYTNSARTSGEDLRRALQAAIDAPDLVIKARRPVRDNWRRRLGSFLYNLECRLLFGLSTWDVNGTPKVFPRRFASLLLLRRDDDLIDLEFGIICKRQGYRVREINLTWSGRRAGRSTTRMRSALRLYGGALRLRLEGLPSPR